MTKHYNDVTTLRNFTYRQHHFYLCNRFRLIGLPVNRLSCLIGPNCEERNPIKDNAQHIIRIIGPLFC